MKNRRTHHESETPRTSAEEWRRIPVRWISRPELAVRLIRVLAGQSAGNSCSGKSLNSRQAKLVVAGQIKTGAL